MDDFSIFTSNRISYFWGYVENLQAKISILGIVAIIVTAFTSVLTVSINNKKAKEREYELHILKEKQKVFEHFYNSYFEILFNIKKGKSGLSTKAEQEMMLFKKGLMNWDSDKLIKKYSPLLVITPTKGNMKYASSICF